jgi:hypothetical protein
MAKTVPRNWPAGALYMCEMESVMAVCGYPRTFVNCFTYAARGLSYLALGQRALEIANMAAIAKFLFRTTGSNVEDETVQTIIILCGMGLLLLLLFLTYGLDLCPEFI